MTEDDLEPVLETTMTTSTICHRNWFYFHVFCYIVILLSSFAMVFHFPFLWLKFDSSCPLYAVPVVKNLSTGEFKLLVDDIGSGKTQWGSDSNCNYCFFTPAFSFVISFIWCWFFCFCNTGSRLESNKMEVSVLSANQKWRIIPPATVCAIIMSILTLVSSSIMSAGMNKFCEGMKSTPAKSCHLASSTKWKNFNHLTGFYSNAVWAIAESWVMFSFWLLLTVTFFVQCCEGPGGRYRRIERKPVLSRMGKTAMI